MRNAPEDDGANGNAADEPLHAGEFVLYWADGDDGGVLAGLEGGQEEEPDQQDGNDADGEGNKKPRAPAGFRAHIFKGDDILWRGDRGCGTANVGGEGNA